MPGGSRHAKPLACVQGWEVRRNQRAGCDLLRGRTAGCLQLPVLHVQLQPQLSVLVLQRRQLLALWATLQHLHLLLQVLQDSHDSVDARIADETQRGYF
jgi:hypothetical protein